MKLRREHCVALLVASIANASSMVAAHSADAPVKRTTLRAQPDVQFLEYLGTLEGDEDNWTAVAEVPNDAKPKAVDAAKTSTPVKKLEATSQVVESK